MIAILVPLGSLVAVVAVVGIAMYFAQRARELRHRERMLALEKGQDLPADPRPGPEVQLLRGLIWLSVGIGVVVFFFSVSFADGDRSARAVASLGLIPLGIGIAHLVVYRKLRKEATSNPQ